MRDGGGEVSRGVSNDQLRETRIRRAMLGCWGYVEIRGGSWRFVWRSMRSNSGLSRTIEDYWLVRVIVFTREWGRCEGKAVLPRTRTRTRWVGGGRLEEWSSPIGLLAGTGNGDRLECGSRPKRAVVSMGEHYCNYCT